MSKTVELFIPPHADVRIICEDLSKMRDGFRSFGVWGTPLDAAIDMLTRQSIEIQKLREKA